MPKKKRTRTPAEDRAAFIAAAKELGCDTDAAAFDAKLRKLVKAPVTTNDKLKKGKKRKGK